jgi:hypothetical protein
VSVLDCKRRWHEGDGNDHHDIPLPVGLHLNMERMSVPPASNKGLRLTTGICRHIANLPQALRFKS